MACHIRTHPTTVDTRKIQGICTDAFGTLTQGKLEAIDKELRVLACSFLLPSRLMEHLACHLIGVEQEVCASFEDECEPSAGDAVLRVQPVQLLPHGSKRGGTA
jgi:hypothetical protein